MKYLFSIFIFYLIIKIIYSSDLDGDLNYNYPFSIKKGYNEVVIFMENHITIYNTDNSKVDKDIPDCVSGPEKGGIYLNSYYYTSCRDSNTKFRIKICQIINDNIICQIYPEDSTNGFTFSESSTIKFFRISAEEELVGVAWIDANKLHLLHLKETEKKDYIYYDISGSNYARDIDCIFINKRQSTVCVFGKKMTSNGLSKYSCSANIFNGLEMITNFKEVLNEDCPDHHSRKIRGYTNIREERDKSDIFYYYFVDADNNAKIMPVRLKSMYEFELVEGIKGIFTVMTVCNSAQHSYDMAEDRFMGYDVFVCVDDAYKQKIKIQLFKLEDNKIIFYNGNEDPGIPTYTFPSFPSSSSYSMINFVVLKESLKFGFLTYKIDNKAKYTILYQPTCNNFPTESQSEYSHLSLSESFTDIDFDENINNDNFDEDNIDIIIVDQDKGIQVTALGKKVTITSYDFISGDLFFYFQVYNGYFLSEICTGKVKVTGCHPNCETCIEESNKFENQKCKTCNTNNNYYEMKDYPSEAYGQIDGEKMYRNCCNQNVDCPEYFYFNKDHFELCKEECLTCNENNPDECLTCCNEYEVENKFPNEFESIQIIKGSSCDFFLKDRECKNEDIDYFYKNKTTLKYTGCYPSCKTCDGDGNSFYHNCLECKNDYYHYLNSSSRNCFKIDEVELGLYPTEQEGKQVLAKCKNLCLTCVGENNDQCTSCVSGSYYKCEEKENPNFECYDSIPGSHFYFDLENKCYGECDPSCIECDKGPDNISKNCIKCNEEAGQILFNKNCKDHCPLPYFELERKKCLEDCPEYTEKRYTNGYNICYNCITPDAFGQVECIYMGTNGLAEKNKCISCDLPGTFKCNTEYNILDDCYQLCKSCFGSGTIEKMNCEFCKDDTDENLCLIKDLGNCVLENTPVDYYYMTTENGLCVYKQCYETCKTCAGEGNLLHHNCTTCKDNFQFDPSISGNCVELCDFYWYIEPKTNKFTCTKEEKCPDNLPYLTEINKGCVEQCSAASHNGERFFYRYKDTCITKCPENTVRDNLLYACHSLDNVNDIFTYMSNYISQGIYADNLLIFSSDNKKYFHLFNTTNLGKEIYEKSALKVGTSVIDLSNCISTLKQIYGLTNNEILYIGILDVVRDDTSAPQFEYTIHNHLGSKLDINFCINNELTIQKSLNQSSNISLAKDILAQYDYDIIDYNKDNPFFCDICSLFDYDHLDSYDVLLNDRYDYYYNNQEYYFCEENCNAHFTKIDLNNSRVECVCSGKGNFSTFKEQKFQRYQKFSQNCKDGYMQYFKCYKNVFNKNLFKKNIGNYFTFTFIIIQIGTLLLFYFYSKKPMMSHIHDVLIKRAKKRYDKESGSSSISGSYSGSRSGSESYSRSGSMSGSQSGSKSGSRSISRSESQSGSRKNSFSESDSGSKNSKANPPKSEKSKYAFVSIDNNEKNNDNDNNEFNLNIEKEENNNKINNEEEKNNTNDNKNAPNPIGQKYATRYLNNRNDYLDNSFREDSYNFDIPKKKKKNEDDSEEEEEEDEDQNGGNNEEGKNNGKGNENKNENGVMTNKPKKKGKKREELPPAAVPAKTGIEKFKDEIKKFNKFSFIELYWFIIRKKQRILALIFKKDIYDIFAIKFSLLILSYTIDFFVTTFFFFESEIRNLFHKKTHIDILYIIFMGLFCIFISTVLIRIVDYLMEYRMNFKKYEILQKYENDNSNYFNSLNNMIKGFNHKMIIYFIVNFVFSIFVWYMVSAFIATYYNSRLTWGIMILFNFLSSNIFPFIYYFVAVILQHKGIHKEDYKLYKSGMIMLKI